MKCRYLWKSRKNYGLPSACPNCKSHIISYDAFKSVEKPLFIGFIGVVVFIVGIISNDEVMKVFGNIGAVIGFPLFIVSILMILDGKRKNEKLRKQRE